MNLREAKIKETLAGMIGTAGPDAIAAVLLRAGVVDVREEENLSVLYIRDQRLGSIATAWLDNDDDLRLPHYQPPLDVPDDLSGE
ncbi:hypothetical protein [Nocardia sp. NPDC047654]|uniref:hypothetical protein n=1 Tax=Nocardia sp. NPDC047654 TaxID=3364314 RepID=UPI0037167DE8